MSSKFLSLFLDKKGLAIRNHGHTRNTKRHRKWEIWSLRKNKERNLSVYVKCREQSSANLDSTEFFYHLK